MSDLKESGTEASSVDDGIDKKTVGVIISHEWVAECVTHIEVSEALASDVEAGVLDLTDILAKHRDEASELLGELPMNDDITNHEGHMITGIRVVK